MLIKFNMLRLHFILTAIFFLISGPIDAHPGHAQGFSGGLAHPLSGWDHILVMVAVGVIAAALKGKNIWILPAAFILSMLTGFILAFYQIAFPMTETFLRLSIIGCGALLILFNFAHRGYAPVATLAVLLFGLFHGNAHGMEGDKSGEFAVGMLMATAALHAAGLSLGLALHSKLMEGKIRKWAYRLSGFALASAGILPWIMAS